MNVVVFAACCNYTLSSAVAPVSRVLSFSLFPVPARFFPSDATVGDLADEREREREREREEIT